MLFSWVNSSRTLRIKIATFSSRILRIKNAKFLEYCFYVNTSIYRDFQICISVPLRHKKFNSGFGLILISVPVHKEMSVFIVYTIVLESYHYLKVCLENLSKKLLIVFPICEIIYCLWEWLSWKTNWAS